MRKLYITHSDVKNYTLEIIRECVKDNFTPNVIIAPVRGGLVVGNYVSQYFDVPLIALNKDYDIYDLPNDPNVLIVDDINDTGATFNKLESDFMVASFGLQSRKYGVLLDNQASGFCADYCGKIINKAEDNCWVVFPWEEWWKTNIS